MKRRKIIVWQSADSRVTSDHCRVTVQRLFSKFSQIAWNVQKTLFDSRPTVAWPQPLSRDVQRLFSKFSQIAWNVQKNVVWQSADGRVTSDHCRVTVQRLFSEFSQIAWNVQKTLFDSRPTVAWPPTTVAWPFSDFFKIFPNRLKRLKNVVWQSADGRVTSTTVAWPFSDFFQNILKSLETSKKRCLTVGRRSRDLRPRSRDRSATFFKKISNCLKRRKIVVWQSADSRLTSDHCHVTAQRLFSKKFLMAWNVEKIVVWQSADGRVTSTTVAWPFSDFFSKFSQIAWNVQKTLFDSRPMVAWPLTTLARHHILPRRCISRCCYIPSAFDRSARAYIISCAFVYIPVRSICMREYVHKVQCVTIFPVRPVRSSAVLSLTPSGWYNLITHCWAPKHHWELTVVFLSLEIIRIHEASLEFRIRTSFW